MMKKQLTFNEVFPYNPGYFRGRGFFYTVITSLGEDFYNKFFQIYTTGVDLGGYFKSLHYRFLVKNGERIIDINLLNSPFVQDITDGGIFDSEDKQFTFFSTFFLTFNYKWSKMLNNVYAQIYNPIENYNRTEENTFTKTGIETETRTDSRNIKTDTVNSENITGSNSTETTGSGSADNFINGFNSTQSVPSDNSKSSNTANASSSSQTTNSQNGNLKTNEEISSAVNRSFTDRADKTQGIVKGNIGVTTTQQMLESEVIFRLKNDFIENIFKDIENTLFSAIF